ncbi:MAG: nitrate reductase [Verrucomicrobiota bacterium]
MSSLSSIRSSLDPALIKVRAHNGPMTGELVRHPADFGLGLPQLPSRLKPASTVKSVCGFCATGCSLDIHLDAQGHALNLSADSAYPVNLGMACPKGWEALTPLAASDRATVPLVRDTNNGPLEPVTWPVALETFTRRFKAIQAAHGDHSIAFLSTGQIPTEEMALVGALFKFGMGGLHCDSNTRQCMATAHVAYKQSFGFDAPPYTYKDFEESDVLVFVGSNPAIAHPIMWQRVQMNKNSPEIIVVDPRRTETAMCATRHVALNPKSDLTLLYSIAHVLNETGWIKRDFIDAHTSGYEAFAAFLKDYNPKAAEAVTGVSAETIRHLAEIIARGKAVSFWWTMGVNQGYESTRTAQAIINLALMTGNIGRPGTGANSITGQCNAMGSRLYANATSLFGGRDFANATHRAEVAGILGIDAAHIPAENSLAYDQIIDAIDDGKIKGLWIIATNTAHSWINSSRFARIREKLEFLVVQDMYVTTESAQMADLLLPAAAWGEKEGFFINSERRLGAIHKVARAPGQALSDFRIFQLIAQAWGCADRFAKWSSPAAAFQLIKEFSRGRPCDITGIRDHAHLTASGGIQWPHPDTAAGEPAQERRLFADGRFFTPDQRARFLFDAPLPNPEPPCTEYPFILNTGRGSSAQWHTGTRTNKSDVLRKLAPRALYVEINPEDAARLGLAANASVTVRSRRGEINAFVVVTGTVRPGHVFMPMHFGAVNQLTHPSYDPHSRQPNYKACAVQINRA